MSIQFDRDFEPCYGEMVAVSPLLRRIVCNNPSIFTFAGTGTYVIGHGDVAVVDPGPNDETHVETLLRNLGGETIRAILITHTHGDHSPAAGALHDLSGAPLLGYGPHPQDAVSEEADVIAEAADMIGESAETLASIHAEYADTNFKPDTQLAHGDIVEGPGWTVQALHTPGHISNHLCFALAEEQAVLTGDHVMGWSSTVIPPPDGDIAQYLQSLRLLLDRQDEMYYPTHGGPIHKPRTYAKALLNHRLGREKQILAQLAIRETSAMQLVEVLYTNVPKALHPLAARSVVSHFIKLQKEGVAAPLTANSSPLASNTIWALN